MTRRITLDDLLKGPLEEAASDYMLWGSTARPAVKTFAEELAEYRQMGQRLLEDHLTWKIMSPFLRMGNSEIRHEYGIDAVCSHNGHRTTIARASIPAATFEEYPSIDAFAKGYMLKHSDLIYSDHTEIIEDGHLVCPDCGNAPELRLATKIHRVLPSQDLEAASARVIDEIARSIFTQQFAKNPKKTLKTLERQLEEYLGVGPTFRSIGEALWQTRAYRVNVDDLFRNFGYYAAKVLRRDSMELMGTLKSAQRKELAEEISTAAARAIKPPHVVVVTRIKGDSFADKYVISKYWRELNEAFADGRLNEFLREQGVPEIAAPAKPQSLTSFLERNWPHLKAAYNDGKLAFLPEGQELIEAIETSWRELKTAYSDGTLQETLIKDAPMPFKQRDLRDVIGLRAIVHGDAPFYNLQIGNQQSPQGEQAGEHRLYALLHQIFPTLKKLPVPRGKTKQIKPKPEYANTAAGYEHEQFRINPADVDDTMQHPSSSGYRAVHITCTSSFMGTPIPFELQLNTNYNDSLAHLDPCQNPNVRKAQQAACADFLVHAGILAPPRLSAYRTLLSPDFSP